MDPITALAAFNVACATVREAAQHSGDIIQIFKGMGQAMQLKEQIQKRATDKGESDLEAYAVHAQMKQKHDEIVELLKWTGHWDNYLEFCRDRRAKEQEERLAVIRKRNKRNKNIKEIALAILVSVLALAGIGIIIGIIWLATTKGRV